MLKILYGPAGSGKTTRLIREICVSAAAGEAGQILLVPEQFSHDAERELCAAGGDKISRYAEVLTFTRLSNRVLSETGGGAERYLDAGGRLIVMQLAVKMVEHQFKRLRNFGRRPEFLKSLVTAVDEMKASRLTPSALTELLEGETGLRAERLVELALIFEAYEAVCTNTARDPRDTLEVLAEAIPRSRVLAGRRIYVDGYSGFTAQEMAVLRELLKKTASVTVAVTADARPELQNEAFIKGNDTIRRLRNIARDCGATTEAEYMPPGKDKPEELRMLADGLYDYDVKAFKGETNVVCLYAARDVYDECAAVADRIRTLVRQGARFRDIVVTARDFERYRTSLESVFERYEIPLFTGEKSGILEKPILIFVSSALEIILSDFEYEDVFRYLKSGLGGLAGLEQDNLENYVISWDIRGRSWRSGKAWSFHPSGRPAKLEEADAERLAELNALREKVAAPLIGLRKAMSRAETAGQYTLALYDFMEKSGLPESIERRRSELLSRSKIKEADEYRQLWGILCDVMDQFVKVLGDMRMDFGRFASLLSTCLAAYDVGTIPISIDRVMAGDADRTRKRGVKHVLIMGADEGHFPYLSEGSGVITDEDREFLENLGVETGASPERRFADEAAIILSIVSMASESLWLSYSKTSADGGGNQPSIIFSRAARLLGLRPKDDDDGKHMLSAEKTCFELALKAGSSVGREQKYAAAAREYLLRRGCVEDITRLERAYAYACKGRPPISTAAATALYGGKLRLSSSRMDSFGSCKFKYFCSYGLRARPRTKAALAAADAGTFMHYVLEKAVRRVMDSGGFKESAGEKICEYAQEYAQKYIEEEVPGYEDRDARYKYIFSRLMRHVNRISENMARELGQSEFKPIDFELNFADGGDLPPVESPDSDALLSGFVDRVDGYVKDDKLYIRVIDYKSGVKKFSLGDIYNGLGLQMLIYLFALEQASARYGRQIVPAGALYVPVREEIVRAGRDDSVEDITARTERTLRRSGIVLNDPEIIEAMEKNIAGEAKFLPVKRLADGSLSETSFAAGEEQFERLNKHVLNEFQKTSGEVSRGLVNADPVYRGEEDTACRFCEFRAACLFEPAIGGSAHADGYRRFVRIDNKAFWEAVSEDGDRYDSGEEADDDGLSVD